LAETTRPVLLFESVLPVRYYMPREDVCAPARPSPTRTRCAYKGEARYLSFDVGEDLAWYYVDPLNDAVPVKDLVAFYNEVLEITVDGVPQPRPDGPVAEAMIDEFGL